MKNSAILLSASILCICTSCNPVLYSSVGQNVPLFKEKGEVAIAASLGTTEDAGGIAFQFAAAPDSSLAIITSFYAMGSGKNTSSDNSTDWQGKGNYFEIGAGKFGRIGGNFHYEAFLGLGFGGIRNSYGSSSNVDVKFIKPFLQPSVGLIANQWFDLALTPRIAYVSYTDFMVRTQDQTLQQEADDFYRDKKNSIVLEPGVTIRWGYRSIKAQLQYSGTTLSARPQTYVNINSNYFSLGVQWLISKRYIKNK